MHYKLTDLVPLQYKNTKKNIYTKKKTFFYKVKLKCDFIVISSENIYPSIIRTIMNDN